MEHGGGHTSGGRVRGPLMLMLLLLMIAANSVVRAKKKIVIEVPYHIKTITHTHTVYKVVPDKHHRPHPPPQPEAHPAQQPTHPPVQHPVHLHPAHHPAPPPQPHPNPKKHKFVVSSTMPIHLQHQKRHHNEQLDVNFHGTVQQQHSPW